MIVGEFYTSIGDKNRIAIPKTHRQFLTETVVLTRGYERSIILTDIERWDLLMKEISKKSLLSIDIRDTKRFIVGGAVVVKPDNQGRLVLSEGLKKYGGLDEKIVFIGMGEWIEIWDEDRWHSKLEDLSNKVADLGERISKL